MNFRNTFWGVILIVVGSLFLLEEFSTIDFGRFFLPILLIVAGGLLLLRHQFKSGQNSNSNF
jgi:membrane-bound ClpP family serine protease